MPHKRYHTTHARNVQHGSNRPTYMYSLLNRGSPRVYVHGRNTPGYRLRSFLCLHWLSVGPEPPLQDTGVVTLLLSLYPYDLLGRGGGHIIS